jgi:sugar lactone lactonase YvrE
LDIECVVDSKNMVGESPLWHPDENSLFWTDINGFRVCRYRFKDRVLTNWKFDEPVCTLSLTTDSSRLLVALGSRVILWSPDTDARADLARPEPNWPQNRLNDGATDPNGFFWVGSMRNNVSPEGAHLDVSGHTGSLYRVSNNGQISVWDTGFGITNTLVWSPDRKTFYCGCSIENVIYAYDYDITDSSIRNRRPFVKDLPRGVPDGSAIDSEGCIWNCRFFGSSILRLSPRGEVDTVIEMPVTNITSCAFGGPDLNTLYVTTASLKAPAGERLAGGLFAMQTEVRGLPTGRFQIGELKSKIQN